MSKDDFKYLSQDFDSKALDLVRQKGIYPYENMSGFKSLKKNCQANKFYSSLTGNKLVIKIMSTF